jgi:hypothetical protein
LRKRCFDEKLKGVDDLLYNPKNIAKQPRGGNFTTTLAVRGLIHIKMIHDVYPLTFFATFNISAMNKEFPSDFVSQFLVFSKMAFKNSISISQELVIMEVITSVTRILIREE